MITLWHACSPVNLLPIFRTSVYKNTSGGLLLKWIQKAKQKNLIQARKFSNMFRFIDDLIVINDGSEFEKVYHKVFPSKLELKRQNSSEKQASVLDLDIVNKNFSLSFYDKRESPFYFLS